MAKIIIRRTKNTVGRLQNHNVFLINTFIGELRNGETLEINADVGIHLITFNSTLAKSGKNANFSVVINEPDEIVELETKFEKNGEYTVAYSDNRPHIPVGVNAQNAKTQIVTAPEINAPIPQVTQNSYGFCCPRCGGNDFIPISDVSTKGKDFKAGRACCGFLCFGPIGILCGLCGKGSRTTTTTFWLCKKCGNKFQTAR